MLKAGIAAVVLVAAGVVTLNSLRATAQVFTVRRGAAVDVVTGSVEVHADKDLQEIKSELPGRVVWIDPRQLGEPFKAGDPILKLDSTDLEREITQAQGDYEAVVERLRIQKQNDPALETAKVALATAERRRVRNEISDEELKTAQRAVQRVETELLLADFDARRAKVNFENAQAARQRQLEKMTIRAPMDGACQAVMVAPGTLITAGTTVATFFSNQRVVIAKVSEEDVGRVKVDQPAKVRLLNQPGTQFDAKVTGILPFAEENTQRYSVYLQVKADLGQLLPFSTGEATITVGERDNQPLVPRRALFNDDYVFVVRNGAVEKRQIQIGFRALNFAEVTGRLEPGEQVIVEDVDQFRDGQRVRVEGAR